MDIAIKPDIFQSNSCNTLKFVNNNLFYHLAVDHFRSDFYSRLGSPNELETYLTCFGMPLKTIW